VTETNSWREAFEQLHNRVTAVCDFDANEAAAPDDENRAIELDQLAAFAHDLADRAEGAASADATVWHAALASRQGTRTFNCDAAVIHQVADAGPVAAAVIDGIGSSAEVAAYANLAAQVAARVGARRGAILGVLAAADLNTGPAGTRIEPDGVAALAIAYPDGATSIAWTGDSRAYGYDGRQLHQLTTDMTVADYLRANGFPVEATIAHEDWIRTSLGRSTINTVHHTGVEHRLILLTSDGVHKQITDEHLTDIVRAHAGHGPAALAEAIVNAPQTDDEGYRDDATAIVLSTTS
jgi:protein phosphatase